MKMVMFTEKSGTLAFVYRHPVKHRLMRVEFSSEYLPDFFASLQKYFLIDVLSDTGGGQQDWHGRSPSFWPEWREAFFNAALQHDFRFAACAYEKNRMVPGSVDALGFFWGCASTLAAI